MYFCKAQEYGEIEMVNDICLLFLRMAYVKDNLHRDSKKRLYKFDKVWKLRMNKKIKDFIDET